ncbi:MAG: YkgJ family cysteine cluster protein [Lachnospiraceae bacterium]
MFMCDCCGCCCRNLSKSELYLDLDRGDGICKYLEGNLCLIYEERPLLCRVDDCYELFFKDSISVEEYYKLNMDVCKKLKDMEE